MSSKANLRKAVKAAVRLLTSEEKAAASVLQLSLLEQHPRFRKAQTVLLYCSLPDEVDTHAFLTRWGGKKRLLLPVVDGKDMFLRCFTSEADLRSGAFGIDEPIGEPFSALSEIDLVIVPGQAFDLAGHRLGRGKGYYDRFLMHPALHAYKLGLCLPCQLVEEVPTEDYDVVMDEVIS